MSYREWESYLSNLLSKASFKLQKMGICILYTNWTCILFLSTLFNTPFNIHSCVANEWGKYDSWPDMHWIYVNFILSPQAYQKAMCIANTWYFEICTQYWYSHVSPWLLYSHNKLTQIKLFKNKSPKHCSKFVLSPDPKYKPQVAEYAELVLCTVLAHYQLYSRLSSTGKMLAPSSAACTLAESSQVCFKTCVPISLFTGLKEQEVMWHIFSIWRTKF